MSLLFCHISDKNIACPKKIALFRKCIAFGYYIVIYCTVYLNRLESEVKDEDIFHIGFHGAKQKYGVLLGEKLLSAAAVIKLARNGVTPMHLKLAHDRNGLKLLFNSLNVHVTNKCLQSLICYFQRED